MRPALNPPAIIQPARDLFSWAKEQADAIEATRARLEERRAELATVEAIVEESGEYADLEEAKEAVKKAQADALDCDAVLRAKKQLKKARAALKRVAAASKAKSLAGQVRALAAVVSESKDRLASGLASGLAAGKVPTVVPDETKRAS